MALEEQRQAAIITCVNLMRIKAHETGDNKELEYQIRIAKVMPLGESSVGKDIFAQALHNAGPRSRPACRKFALRPFAR